MKAATLTVVAVNLLTVMPQGDAAKADLDKLQGDWKVQSVEVAGKALINVKLEKLTIKGNKLDGLGPEMTVKLAPDQKPKAIDLANTGIEGKETTLAIYELDGDTLKICWSEKDPDHRPSEFTGKESSGQTLLVLKRAKKG